MKLDLWFDIDSEVTVVPKDGAIDPRYGWGEVKLGHIGVVIEIRTLRQYGRVETEAIVNFPSQHHWVGDPVELVQPINILEDQRNEQV